VIIILIQLTQFEYVTAQLEYLERCKDCALMIHEQRWRDFNHLVVLLHMGSQSFRHSVHPKVLHKHVQEFISAEAVLLT